VPGRHRPDVGGINDPSLFQAIDGRGDDGWIGCAYEPRGDTVAGLGWARDFGIGQGAGRGVDRLANTDAHG
jgi:hydroxypyruvate isomerase